MVGIRQEEKNNERNECMNERSTTKKLTNESEHGHGQFLMRVLKEGVPVAFPSPFFFEIPLPGAQIPFPPAECGKNPSVIRIPPLFDPTKTQKFTRIYKDLLKIIGSFQTVIRLSSSEFIAISPCHFTFLPFLPAGNLPSDL